MRDPLSRFKFLGKFHLAASSALLAGIFILAYGLLVHWNVRFDLTQTGVFTLSPVTLNVLGEIKSEPVKVIGFFRTESGEGEAFKELLKSYQMVLDKLEVLVFDPDRSPSKVKEYRVDDYGTVIVEFRGRTERVKGMSEEKITNAFLRVIRNERKKIYFVKGHGEFSVSAEGARGLTLLSQRLRDENYKVETVALMEAGVSKDASCVVIAGPKADFYEPELAHLEEYLKRGGALLVLIDPVDPGSLSRFENWVRKHGVNAGEDIIVDKLGKVLGADFLVPLITQYQSHEITQDFTLASLLPVARSLAVTNPLPPGVEVKPLAYTSPSSWAESDLKSLEKGEAFLDPAKDTKGPLPIACVARNQGANAFKLIVFGDSDFITNANVNISGNRDLILKTLAWLSGELALVSIREKKRPDTPLVLKAQDEQILFWLPAVYLPSGILILGGVVNGLRRRSKKKHEIG